MKRLSNTTKNALRQVRHHRVRATLSGTSSRPRLSVFRGLKSISAQLIDDSAGKTLCAASSGQLKLKKKSAVEGKNAKVAAAYLVGKALAEQASAKKITMAVFDRGGYRYHGRVAALAEGARAGGLVF